MDNATIQDIANESGVSKTTVSRFLNNNLSFMSVETQKRIAGVISKYNYVPNTVARTLRSKKSNLIGVVTNSLRYQVGSKTVMGINDGCSKEGYGTVVYCSDDDPQEENEAIQRCINQQIDGLVIIPSEDDPRKYTKICERGIPVVLCTRYLEGWPYGAAYVKHSDLITQTMKHLIQQGFTKIRFYYDVPTFHKLRMVKTVLGIAKNDLEMRNEDAICEVGTSGFDLEEDILGFVRKYPDEKKAIFAVNTYLLFSLLKTIEKLRIRVPEDLGICGYDMLGWSELVSPGITSLYQPMYEMGQAAAKEVIGSIKEKRESQNVCALDGELFIRNSTLLK